MDTLEKNYNPKDIESKIYKKWEDSKAFSANPNPKKKPFTIMMPPPNVTGQLHMGHALDISIQDSIIRYKRMRGFEALWQPGTDHAAISTEVKIVDKLKNEGKSKYDLGRDGFLKEAWDWKEKYENRIISQQKAMGASCDWDKIRFTMDEACSKAVLATFKNLYDKGLIYKGDRIVNYCPHCHTTLSDAEVEYKEQEGALYHIKYNFKDSKDYVVVATTRPETMLGDSAVAYNPNDDRYKKYEGKTLILPIVNKEIPFIADEYVEMDFGTGLVKITPCHDPNDYEVGLRHNLEKICIFDDDANINFPGSKYHGMDRIECRKLIVDDLKKDGYLEKIEPYNHNVGTHDRCDTNIEPMVKSQWFVKMKDLAKPAIDEYKKGELKFIPDSYGHTYLHWLENIKDWCISRQIWWGHRIPAYYCDDCGEMFVSSDKNDNIICPKCKSKNVRQDEDTLDTWFSSALWPFSTLGWPDNTEEYKYFYPTNVLITAYDIIFFWVIRMVFSGIEQTGKLPFNEVLIHGIVRDDQNRKMSKSLGNGIDPLDIVEKYGADALRMALLTNNSPGNDMRFIEKRVEASRNFLNKIWNATRFILMQMDKLDNINMDKINNVDIKNIYDKLGLKDKWIISKLQDVTKDIIRNIDKYELGIALDKIEKFIWEEYCDWYIEFSKIDFNENTMIVLLYVLNNSLKLLHPFCPFITEEIYGIINDGKMIIKSDFPIYDEKLYSMNLCDNFILLKDIITNIRNKRAELNIPSSKKSDLYIVSDNYDMQNMMKECSQFISILAKCENVYVYSICEFGEKHHISDNELASNYLSATYNNLSFYMPLGDLVDKNKEKEKLLNEIEKTKSEITRAENMLNNERFISKAPKEKIDEEKAKLEKYKLLLDNLNQKLKLYA